MKLLDYKNMLKFDEIKKDIKLRLMIIKSSIIYTFQLETAYVSENWSNMASTLFYTGSFILFLKVVYGNVDTIAGYTEDEMLFLTFIGQLIFYLVWGIFHQNLRKIEGLVQKGDLDLILTKPVPADFYIAFKRISIISPLRDGLTPLVVLVILIDWGSLIITPLSALSGFITMILGLVAYFSLLFIVRLPVFWLGRGSSPAELVYTMRHYSRDILPFESFNKGLQGIFLLLIPILIDTGLATSVFLNKSEAVPALLISFFVASAFILLRKWLWKRALMAYSSASS